MPYSLVREGDGAGDSGQMSSAFWANEDGGVSYQHDTEPFVGAGMKVGSHYGRSYTAQDYWMTTPVTEILERTEEADGSIKVRFKTRNSIYVWRKW